MTWKNKSDISAFPGFRVITGFSRYAVSDRGDVASFINGRLKKCWVDGRGYPSVGLQTDEGKTKIRRVHVLVAAAFIGPRAEGMETCHIDGNPLNNHVSNLRYGTGAENLADKRRHGRVLVGENHPNAKLTRLQIAQIRSEYKREHRTKSNSKELSLKYGVCMQTIAKIVFGRLHRYRADEP